MPERFRIIAFFSFFDFHLRSQLMNNSVPIIEKQLRLKMIINLSEGQKSVPTFVRIVAGLGEKTVEKVLRDFGLTEKEIEVYVFLAKHGVLKSREAASQIKKDKAKVLRILKSLQRKGLAE